MELRLLIAYGLIALIATGGLGATIIFNRRRARRRLRLRGVKTDEHRMRRPVG